MYKIHRYIFLSVMIAVWSNCAVAKEANIDTLVAAYQKASQSHAYKIMNQIKQKIAAMSKYRQKNAIAKVRNAVELKENSEKKSAFHGKALDSIKEHTAEHPDPLSVMSGGSIGSHGSSAHANGGLGGMSDGLGGGKGGIGDGPGGGMGDGPGGGMGGGRGGR